MLLSRACSLVSLVFWGSSRARRVHRKVHRLISSKFIEVHRSSPKFIERSSSKFIEVHRKHGGFITRSSSCLGSSRQKCSSRHDGFIERFIECISGSSKARGVHREVHREVFWFIEGAFGSSKCWFWFIERFIECILVHRRHDGFIALSSSGSSGSPSGVHRVHRVHRNEKPARARRVYDGFIEKKVGGFIENTTGSERVFPTPRSRTPREGSGVLYVLSCNN